MIIIDSFALMMGKIKTLLVCPLDWGLGHATRMVPVIDLLRKKETRVILAADNRPYLFLKSRFPDLHLIRLPGFTPTYPTKGSMALKMISSLPGMFIAAQKSRKMLDQIVKNEKVDIIISDNRYELSSAKAYSVFVSHQLNIQVPGHLTLFKSLLSKTVNSYIKRFDELWIPDFKGQESLSGQLSFFTDHGLPKHTYLGPLSRFNSPVEMMGEAEYDVMAIVSGPEPQRSLLESLLKSQLLESGLKSFMVRGVPEDSKIETVNNLTIFPHLNDKDFLHQLNNSKMVISRPGYSTIMDLAVLSKKAVFIPTPGQTEQEYLARYLEEKKIAYFDTQKNFTITSALANSIPYQGFPAFSNKTALEETITKLLER